jgi:hypothetical protein
MSQDSGSGSVNLVNALYSTAAAAYKASKGGYIFVNESSQLAIAIEFYGPKPSGIQVEYVGSLRTMRFTEECFFVENPLIRFKSALPCFKVWFCI